MTSMQKKQSGIQRRDFVLGSASVALLSACGGGGGGGAQPAAGAQFKLLAGELSEAKFIVSTTDGTAHRDGTGAQARFYNPIALARQSNGDLWLCDAENHVLRRITPAGVVDTYGDPTTRGTQSGSKTTAQFERPHGLAIYKEGVGDEFMYVADHDSSRIWRINLTTMSNTQGLGQATTQADPVDGNLNIATFPYPEKLAIQFLPARPDQPGSLPTLIVWEASSYGRLRRITSVVDTSIGKDSQNRRGAATGVVTSSQGAVFMALERTIYKYQDGVFGVFAGAEQDRGSVDALGAQARFQRITGLTIDAQDNLYVIDDYSVRKITPAGQVSTVLTLKAWQALVGADATKLSDLLMTGPNTMAVTTVSAVGILTIP